MAICVHGGTFLPYPRIYLFIVHYPFYFCVILSHEVNIFFYFVYNTQAPNNLEPIQRSVAYKRFNVSESQAEIERFGTIYRVGL